MCPETGALFDLAAEGVGARAIRSLAGAERSGVRRSRVEAIRAETRKELGYVSRRPGVAGLRAGVRGDPADTKGGMFNRTETRRRWAELSRDASRLALLALIAERSGNGGGDAERLIPPAEAAARLGLVRRHQIDRLVELELLPVAARSPGGYRRFRIADVEALVARARALTNGRSHG
jgi:hypothetical protein